MDRWFDTDGIDWYCRSIPLVSFSSMVSIHWLKICYFWSIVSTIDHKSLPWPKAHCPGRGPFPDWPCEPRFLLFCSGFISRISSAASGICTWTVTTNPWFETGTANQNNQARTGVPGQDSQDRTTRTGQLGQDNLDGTTWTGQPGQGSQKRTAWTGRSGQDSLDKTAMTGNPGQDRIITRQLGLDSWIGLLG